MKKRDRNKVKAEWVTNTDTQQMLKQFKSSVLITEAIISEQVARYPIELICDIRDNDGLFCTERGTFICVDDDGVMEFTPDALKLHKLVMRFPWEK